MSIGTQSVIICDGPGCHSKLTGTTARNARRKAYARGWPVIRSTSRCLDFCSQECEERHRQGAPNYQTETIEPTR